MDLALRGQGITNGALASLVIPSLICRRNAHFAEILEPGRIPLGLPAMAEFASGQAGAVRNVAEHLEPSVVASIEETSPGSGAILRHDAMKMFAVYKNGTGGLSVCSAV